MENQFVLKNHEFCLISNAILFEYYHTKDELPLY
jgi:hypothetical protein